jgi:uncharacterized protein YbjT (DUF2867 family)
MSSELLVFTCASGKQCSRILPHLYGKYTLRLAVNSEHSVQRLKNEYPDAEIVRVDLDNPTDCRQIVTGATSVFHIGPTYRPREASMGFNMVDAAVAESRVPGSKFKHFVFSSAINPQLSKMLNHDRKRLVEEYLIESGLKWTILEPTHFGDYSVTRLLEAVDAASEDEQPVFKAYFNPTRLFSYAFLRDVGEASAKVLIERENHFYATYPLCSTEAMAYSELAERVGAVLKLKKFDGKAFGIEVIDYRVAIDTLNLTIFGSKDVDQASSDTAERMLLYYHGRGLPGNPNVMNWLLGREPTSIEEAVREQR